MMARPLDYSRWDHIEVSDDEDETHPNVDTQSLFRWRHQARVERMEEQKKERQDFERGSLDNKKKLEETRKKLEDLSACAEAETKEQVEAQVLKLQMEMSELKKQEKEWKQKEEELTKKEKLTPWNVDTLSKDKWEKTVINKKPAKKAEATEEEKEEMQRTFVEKNEKLCKKFGMFKKYDDSMQFLTDHPELVCDECANYLAIWCINLQVEEKTALMDQVAHQTIIMQYILELAKSLDADPRACVKPFFSRIKTADKQYTDAFNDELDSFKTRVRGRAEARIERAMKEAEEEERQKRLGPGGLDPVEVFESLPQVLKDCFEKQDIPMLQKAITELPEEDARHHIDRCIKSGLWVPQDTTTTTTTTPPPTEHRFPTKVPDENTDTVLRRRKATDDGDSKTDSEQEEEDDSPDDEKPPGWQCRVQ
ncbi:hsp90 co-chaperone Cdc37-like isoform X1 [Branchiostoma floridae x Branchiostoma belcheri]